MAGALSQASSGDDGDPVTPPLVASAGDDTYQQLMARRAADATQAAGATNPNADALTEFGQDISGQKPGPLTQQQQALAGARSAAAAKQMQAIQSAMQILQQTKGSQTTNMPMLAAAGALLAPTRTGTIGEALGHGFSAAAPAVQQQRQQDLSFAGDMGKLGVTAAGVPLSDARADEQDFLTRLGIGERAMGTGAVTGTRVQTAQIGADKARDVANIQGNDRISVADLMANKGAFKYLGADPTNPGQGIYLNTRNGETNYGPAAPGSAAGSDPARVREANALIQKGVAPDFSTAYAMVRAGTNDVNRFSIDVQKEKEILLKTPQGQSLGSSADGLKKLEQMARETVIARGGSGRPTTTPPAPKPPGGSTPPAGTAPPAGSALPDYTPGKRDVPLDDFFR